jgi:site-specific DNA recombinase
MVLAVRVRESTHDLPGGVDPHVFTDQEISGANSHRPGYQRLLAAARAREFDAIFVEAQDRLWRSQSEMYYAFDRLRF